MDITTSVQGPAGPAVYAAIGGFAYAESAAFLGLLVPAVLRAVRRRTRGPDLLDPTGQPRLVAPGVVS